MKPSEFASGGYLYGRRPAIMDIEEVAEVAGESVDNAPNPMAEFTFDCDADVPAGAFIRRSTDEK